MFGISEQHTSIWERQKALQAQQLGLVGTMADVSVNKPNAAEHEAKNRQINDVAKPSFNDILRNQQANSALIDAQLKANEDAQAKRDGTINGKTNEEINAEGERIAEQLRKQNPGMDIQWFNPNDHLTDTDKAFFEKLNAPDELKVQMRLMLALDRSNGFTDPLTPDYFFGEGGLTERMPSFKDWLLEGEETDSMIEVMNKMRSFAQNIMAAFGAIGELKDASSKDGTVNIYNMENNSAISSWVAKMVKLPEEDDELQKQLADSSLRGKHKCEGNFLDMIQESSKLLV